MDDSVHSRERVVLMVKAGLSRRMEARRFEVSISLVQHWKRHSTIERERYGTRFAVVVASAIAPTSSGGA